MAVTPDIRKGFLPYVVASVLAIYYTAPAEATGHVTFYDVVLKMLPVSYLSLYLYIHLTMYFDTKVARKFPGKGKLLKDRQRLASGVLKGLSCSIVGDALLTQHTNETFFLMGVAAFTIAQIFYIFAFGFSTIRIKLGLTLYGTLGLIAYLVLHDAPFVMQVALALYGALLITMVWRSLDRSLVDDGRTDNQRALMGLGAIIFFVSDLSIALFKVQMSAMLLCGQHFVLITYYVAQGFIAASVLGPR